VLELPAPAFADHRPADSDSDLGADTPEADAAVALLERHAGELTPW
jgi:hypothetical protein